MTESEILRMKINELARLEEKLAKVEHRLQQELNAGPWWLLFGMIAAYLCGGLSMFMAY